MQMKSAYAMYQLALDPTIPLAEVRLGIHEPPYTTVNFRRCWTIDYIWYSHNTLHIEDILEIPHEAELRQEDGPENWHAAVDLDPSTGNYNGIPNAQQGSDHVPLLALFRTL